MRLKNWGDQKGRKPRKGWHRRGVSRSFVRAVKKWQPSEMPEGGWGTPTPLRQGHQKRRRMESL